MQIETPIYVIGDVHGQLKKLVHLLREVELIGENLAWQGGQSVLWFVGDLVDRGPYSIAVLNLVMRLQGEAALAGGQIGCLLGNHELLLLGAYRFGRRSTGLGSNFITRWKLNGGHRKDLGELTTQHLEWMSTLPAMASVASYLLLHADAPLYIRYGTSIDEVNGQVRTLLKHSDALAWEEAIEDFARRGAFANGKIGADFARRFLTIFGGQQLIHGHTPINAFTQTTPKDITAPLLYADNLCIDVDGGMFLGGPGFVYQLPSAPQ